MSSAHAIAWMIVLAMAIGTVAACGGGIDMQHEQQPEMVSEDQAIPGRDAEMPVAAANVVTGEPMRTEVGAGADAGVGADADAGVAEVAEAEDATGEAPLVAYFGMGCFWGAERVFWQLDGVVSTAVGYQGGYTLNPTYEEVSSEQTGHAEVVLVRYDPTQISYELLLKTFWEAHDPTQGMRQGADRGTRYRSTIYWVTPAQQEAARASRETYNALLVEAGHGEITTELAEAKPFYFAEDRHQQYLAKNPRGYCGLTSTGVSCPIGLGVLDQ